MSESEAVPIWRKRLREWRESGLSARQYAAREGITEWAIRKWVGAERKESLSKPTMVLARVKTAPVLSKAGVEIAFANGSVVRVDSTVDESFLRCVVAVVSGARR